MADENVDRDPDFSKWNQRFLDEMVDDSLNETPTDEEAEMRKMEASGVMPKNLILHTNIFD